jgi:hypothetical protein
LSRSTALEFGLRNRKAPDRPEAGYAKTPGSLFTRGIRPGVGISLIEDLLAGFYFFDFREELPDGAFYPAMQGIG